MTNRPSEILDKDELREQAEKQLQDRVLSTISADDFWFKSGVGLGMSGLITKGGLQKLCKHPDVRKIVLPVLMKTQVIQKGKSFSH